MTNHSAFRGSGFRLKGAMLIVGLIVLVACSQPDTETGAVTTACPECPTISCPEPVLYEDVWAASAHADGTSEAFIHWNEDDPPAIPTNCAKCHSLTGYLDFAGADGTTVGVVDRAVAPGTTVTCFACHIPSTTDVSEVLFPSGVRIRNLGHEARCVQCHQGRASTTDVNSAIAAANIPDDDASSEELSFINTHSISGATPFGGEVHGGYEYYGREYQGRYLRAGDFFACFDCHEKHSLELQYALCQDCHTSARADPSDIRVDTTDYDGDGDMDEGIASEIDALYGTLYVSIQDYARDIVGTPIAFDGSSYPYYFIDSNSNGRADEEEVSRANSYNAWTPRLLRAAYNLNYIAHDHGAYAHNPDYVIQLLYDSLEDLGSDVSQLTRPAVRRAE